MRVKYSDLLLILAIATSAFLGPVSLAAKPQVTVNLNDNNSLTTTPVPAYPEPGKDGAGSLFKLQFGKDGQVGGITVLISTDHELLDLAAKSSLAKWGCQPGILRTANITIYFVFPARSTGNDAIDSELP